METVPFTLPACDRPAVVRLELYRWAGDRLGSLEASAYACHDHAEAVGTAVFAAGFMPQVFALAPDAPGRTCGFVHVFATGGLAGSTVGERPAEPGEVCTCGRPAVKVFTGGKHGDVGYCGLPDGGQPGPCPFCGGARHVGERCPCYQLRPGGAR